MQVIEILSLIGHSPFNITICDTTKTYCYLVEKGVVSGPVTVTIPSELSGTEELLTVVTDDAGCETFQPFYCFTPTPTSTQTPTPTPTPTNISCNCITFTNTTMVTLEYGFTDCKGNNESFKIQSGTTLYVCGKLPYADRGVVFTMGLPCIDNTCPTPTSTPSNTPTNTPTPTQTPSHTPTNTPTHTITCGNPVLNTVQYISGTLFGVTYTSSYGCTVVNIEFSSTGLPGSWLTTGASSCSGPGTINVSSPTGTWYFRILNIIVM